jgi:GT2 family glycosyltransferase
VLSVSTTVLNYEAWHDTSECLRALRASSHRRQWLTVVDNGSTNEPTEEVLAQLVGTTFVQTGENLGYAGGNNAGIRVGLERGADLFLVVNPDLRVEPNTIAKLVDAMIMHPEAGIVGPRILNGGSKPMTVWFNGADVDRSTGATRVRDLGTEADALTDEQTVPTDYVTGACMLVRREVLDDIGLIPEEYFLYFEETEFNLRARATGWATLLVGSARGHHYKSAAGRLPSSAYVYYFIRGRLLLAAALDLDGGVEFALDDLQPFIDGWRRRIRDVDAEWLATYQELVDLAIHDGTRRQGGRRDDLPL